MVYGLQTITGILYEKIILQQPLFMFLSLDLSSPVLFFLLLPPDFKLALFFFFLLPAALFLAHHFIFHNLFLYLSTDYQYSQR